MSRIEEALEKAALLRNSSESASPRRPGAHPAHVPPPAPLHGLEVTNQLLVSASATHTPVAEEYRKLKTALVSLTKRESFLNMLMVTSTDSNEGKSITALNLAIALAREHDHTVLLIDADLRRPSIHSYLGMDAREGLSECLQDGREVKDTLIQTGIGRLFLLPAGKRVQNPTELFTSQKTRDFFLEIKSRYPDRFIIIDTPPVRAFAETRSMSTMVDGVVLVVKEGAVSLRHLSETVECLKETEIMGIVYNEATSEGPAVDHQYYRGSYAENG
jgi:protein-tyrosine kinase